MFRSEEPDFFSAKSDYGLEKIGVFRQSGGGKNRKMKPIKSTAGRLKSLTEKLAGGK